MSPILAKLRLQLGYLQKWVRTENSPEAGLQVIINRTISSIPNLAWEVECRMNAENADLPRS